MDKELDEKLTKAFLFLYADRHGDMRSTCMCWGFSCGDGWFDIIWNLSKKLEPLIRKIVKENPNLSCTTCGCEKKKHYASATPSPGRCLAIHRDPTSEEEPPGNYRACFCDSYRSSHPRAAQVKEKFGGLRFYMTSTNDEISSLVAEAEALSQKTCEFCGEEGSLRKSGWWHTLCDACNSKKADNKV